MININDISPPEITNNANLTPSQSLKLNQKGGERDALKVLSGNYTDVIKDEDLIKIHGNEVNQ